MGHVQVVKTPSGDEMVVIPKAEYDALLRLATEAAEDAADVAAYDAAMAEIAADPDSRLPVEISGLMLKGDRLIAAIRKWRGLTSRLRHRLALRRAISPISRLGGGMAPSRP
jgi:hypothetical protein